MAGLWDAIRDDGPAIVDVLTNRQELSMPPKIRLDQAAGFNLYAAHAILNSRGQLDGCVADTRMQVDRRKTSKGRGGLLPRPGRKFRLRTDFWGSTATEEASPAIHRTDASLIGERTFRRSRLDLRNKVGRVSRN